MGRLEGQRALVTGASSGIGAAAQLLARARTRRDDSAARGLWQPSGEGELSGHLHGRPSLLAALQLRGARPPGGGVGRP